MSDSAREEFLDKLLKHDINIDEYCSIYEKSSIPLNNNLSELTLEIFEHNSCLVAQYSKYKNQLKVVIQKHLENRYIHETEEGNFVIQDQNRFTCQFDDIENIVSSIRSEQRARKHQPVNSVNQGISIQRTRSTAYFINTTTEVNVFRDTVERDPEVQHPDLTEESNDCQDIAPTSKNSV